MVKGISIALLMGDRERLTPDEVRECSKLFGVGIRQIYRYQDHVVEARFYMKDLLNGERKIW